MNREKMKNMMILKNLPSNIVDEAIVILKPNVNLKSLDRINKKSSNKKNCKNNVSNKNYIVNEAEMLISNYISKIEENKHKKRKEEKYIIVKYKILKGISLLLAMLLVGIYLIK